jgi:uncharacterized protein
MHQSDFIYIWYYLTILIEQIFPYWIIGVIIGSIVSVFGKSQINNLLGKIMGNRVGFPELLLASLLGIVSPMCMYGTIPIVASFANKGMREDWLAAFMMSSILLNPQLIIYSAVLGVKVFTIRILSSIVCGILAGVLVQYFSKGRTFFNFSYFKVSSNRDTHPRIIVRLLKNIWRNIKATGIYFLIGIILTALFQTYVPNDAFASLFGKQKGLGILIAATLGVPLYICGGGTIPLLLDWLHRGMGLGAAAAFMISGPATKITNLGALKIILGSRNFIIYILFVIIIAILIGVVVNFICGY